MAWSSLGCHTRYGKVAGSSRKRGARRSASALGAGRPLLGRLHQGRRARNVSASRNTACHGGVCQTCGKNDARI